MPCSLCGGIGHNIRTCPNNRIDPPGQIDEPIDEQIDEPIDEQIDEQINEDTLFETMILMERCLREFIIQDKIKDIDEEQLQLYENMLDTKKMDIKLINLEEKDIHIYIVEGNSNFLDFNQSYNIRYLGKIFPRSIMPITAFTGYRYVLVWGESLYLQPYRISDISRNPQNDKNICNLDINKNINDNINLNLNDDDCLSFKELNTKNETLFSLLKHNYLIEQLIRLGAKDNPNLEAILDLHQDIEMPFYTAIDQEAAGIPNGYTNMN